ncbi:MAG: hypothetical protein AAF958_04865 [Planctomycetota bacterium]
MIVLGVCCLLPSGCAGLVDLDRRTLQASAATPGMPNSAGGFAAGGDAMPGAAPPMTLPRFLGLDVLARRTRLATRLAHEKVGHRLPALAPKPLPAPITDPSSASHPSPAVAAAHKAHKAKAAKAAKIKAVGFLAESDCGGDPHIQQGLIAALDDPDSDVRIAALHAVLRSTRGCGTQCGQCCSEAIQQRLRHIAFARRSEQCFMEPSSKARRLARLALDACNQQACGACENCDAGYTGEMIVPEQATELPPEAILQEVLGTP